MDNERVGANLTKTGVSQSRNRRSQKDAERSTIRHARMVRGFTLKKVADAGECSESFISKLENDKASPSFTMLHRLPAILGANVAALFGCGRRTR